MSAPSRLLAPHRPGLVLYLPFWEGAGSVAEDVSPYRNHATLYGPTWVDGKLGKAVSFDGLDDNLQTPTINLSPGASTWAFWMKVNSFEPTWGSKGLLGCDGLGQNTITFLISSGNQVLCYVENSTGTFVALADPSLVSLSVWRHYALTIDDSSPRNTKLYRNGEVIDAQTLAGDINFNFPVKFTKNWWTYHEEEWVLVPYAGVADEIRVFNRGLSDAEMFEEFYLGARG